MLIENSAQSPFNVGEVIELEDFSTRNVQDLNERHGKPFSESELNDLYAITSGHPYLIRQALYRVAISEISPAEILDTSTYTRGNGGIFKDHLHRYRSYFQNQPNLRQKMQGIIQQDVDLSDDEFYRLRSAGLVMINEDQQVLPRCKLYELYFGAKLK